MKQWIQRKMIGRYGTDQLNNCLLAITAVMMFANLFLRWRLFRLLSWALVIYIWYRVLSRNIGKRRHENMLYLQYVNKLTSRFSYRKKKWQDRKTHCYFDCPICHAHLRVPKGKGKIMIRCTHCDHRFEAKS